MRHKQSKEQRATERAVRILFDHYERGVSLARPPHGYLSNLARELGVSFTTIHRDRVRILAMLKKLRSTRASSR